MEGNVKGICPPLSSGGLGGRRMKASRHAWNRCKVGDLEFPYWAIPWVATPSMAIRSHVSRRLSAIPVVQMPDACPSKVLRLDGRNLHPEFSLSEGC